MPASSMAHVAAVVALLASAADLACSSATAPFPPPPRPETSVAAGVIGGGVGTTGVGGAASSGGAGGVASAAGTGGANISVPPQDCICILTAVSNAACATCVSTAGTPPNNCSPLLTNCQLDAACAAILTCIRAQACGTRACIASCIGPTSVASASAWESYEDCVCQNECPQQCYPAGATCP